MKSVIVVFVITLFAGIGMTQTSYAKSVNSSIDVLQQDEVEYKEIESKELPEKVTSTLAESFAGYSISKSYKGTDDSFKVDLSKDEESIVVYFDANGDFLKKETEGE